MPILEVANVSKAFAGLMAVKNISLSVKNGEILGLIGPNGAGKTTLFNIISGTYPPSSGKVILMGNDVTGKSPHAICHLGLARTFQITKPFGNLSTLENVMVGAYIRTNSYLESKKVAVETLKFVGLNFKQDVRTKDMTIGDQRRLELARALATTPKFLLLDEVMAGLTPSEVSEFMEIIRKIRQSGITILMIEHIMSALMGLSDRVFVMHHGEKLAEGTPEQIASNPSVIEAYLGEVELLAENN